MQKYTGKEIEMQKYTGKDSEQLKIIKEWLQGGAKKIEAQDNNGMTALHHAVSKNNKEEIQRLLDNGADLYAKDNQEKTPLDIANEGNNEETKTVLLAEMKKDLHRYEIILKDLSKSTVLSPELQTDIKPELETVTAETFREVHNRATTLSELQKRAYTEVKKILFAKKIAELRKIGINKRNKELFTAASKGDVETVRAIKILDTERRRVGYELETAANKGHAEIVKELLSGSVWIDPQDGVYRNGLDRMSALLINTAKEGHAEVMEALLNENFFDIESRDRNYNTALMWAAREGHLETVKVILHHSGDAIKAINTWKDTALIWAAEGGHAEIVKELLKYRGCDINAINNGGGASSLGGQTALMCAVENDNIKTVEALLDHAECKINMRGRDNVSALMIAARTNNIEIAKLMLPRSNPENIRDSLYCASEVGMVKMILDHMKDRKDINIDIKSLLNNAVKQNNKVMVKGLLAHLDEYEKKPSYVIQGRDKRLMAALSKGNPEVVKALLDSLYNEADTPAVNEALEYAVGRRNKDLVGAIVSSKKCGDSTIKKALEMAIDNLIDELSVRNTDENTEKWVNSARETIKSILSYGKWDKDIIDKIKSEEILRSKQIKEILTFKDKDGKTALHYAVISGDKEFVQELLKRGADIDAKDEQGMTALHHAIEAGNMDIVEKLVQDGANLIAPDNNEKRPFNHPSIKTHLETYRIILTELSESTDLSQKLEEEINSALGQVENFLSDENDVKGIMQAIEIYRVITKIPTALHHAAIRGDKEFVQELLKRGADIDAKDGQGKTALHRAIEAGNMDCVEKLVKNGANLMVLDKNRKRPFNHPSIETHLKTYRIILTELSESTDLSQKLEEEINSALGNDGRGIIQAIEIYRVITQELPDGPEPSALQERVREEINRAEIDSKIVATRETIREARAQNDPKHSEHPMGRVLGDQQEGKIIGGSIELTGLHHTKGHQQLGEFHKEVLSQKYKTVSQQEALGKQGEAKVLSNKLKSRFVVALGAIAGAATAFNKFFGAGM